MNSSYTIPRFSRVPHVGATCHGYLESDWRQVVMREVMRDGVGEVVTSDEMDGVVR